MLKLSPIKERRNYYQLVYKEIKDLLNRILFNPIIEIAESKELENAISKELLSVLRSGKITYAEGYFTGKFNAAIGLELRKIGATWNKSRKAYYLQKESVPTEVKIAIAKGMSDVQAKIAKINKILDNFQKTGVVPNISFSKQVDGVLLDIDSQFKTTIPKDIGIPLTLSDMQKESLRREYTENMNLYIQDMTKKSVVRLREKVQEQVSQGYRASSLLDVIHAQKGVTDRHALFLAKQEISLLTKTYRDSRYKEAGINEWIWSSSHDSRVRPLHRKLDGHKFNYTDKLPIIDEKTGEKGTPGQAYGCRCRLIPLLDTDKYIQLGINKDKSARFEIQ